jgi:hypothetical protein
VVDDGFEIAVGKPAGLGGHAKGSIDLVSTDEHGELGGPADLGPDPLGSRRCGEDEPPLGARAQTKERRLLGTRGLRFRMERVARSLRIVGWIDARVARVVRA